MYSLQHQKYLICLLLWWLHRNSACDSCKSCKRSQIWHFWCSRLYVGWHSQVGIHIMTQTSYRMWVGSNTYFFTNQFPYDTVHALTTYPLAACKCIRWTLTWTNNWSIVDDVSTKTSQRKRQRKSTVCTWILKLEKLLKLSIRKYFFSEISETTQPKWHEYMYSLTPEIL